MSSDEKNISDWVSLGKVSGTFGVKGWMKIFSDTQPKENILKYNPWYLKQNAEWQPFKLVSGKAHGKGVIVQLDGINDCDLAESLKGVEIAIKREQLSKPASGEYYWSDLIGLKVKNKEGIELGCISSMLETGANDVVIVQGEKNKKGKKRERLIPFISSEVILEVDIEQGSMLVDWDAEF
ncbi:MAG: ribosome maturation factor RimM [Woeseiaceae bacterium]